MKKLSRHLRRFLRLRASLRPPTQSIPAPAYVPYDWSGILSGRQRRIFLGRHRDQRKQHHHHRRTGRVRARPPFRPAPYLPALTEAAKWTAPSAAFRPATTSRTAPGSTASRPTTSTPRSMDRGRSWAPPTKVRPTSFRRAPPFRNAARDASRLCVRHVPRLWHRRPRRRTPRNRHQHNRRTAGRSYRPDLQRQRE